MASIPGLLCAFLSIPCGVQLGVGTSHAVPPCFPGQGDTHADLSTSCRIFFTESLMLKAMLLRMFLK